ncbi:MAG: short-chain dehydrogenase [Euryarchaeota archaeon]|nr:short-chain dehydrogenase [Euryarchaeota archaeon]|tara:strand:+ start:627 stop:1532 length:906 start_codon:yes stop_codon:yes gene_type:complete
MKLMNWKIEMMEDQTGKVVIITGSNTGIGYHMAYELASKGADVVMACRNLEKASDSRNKILKDFPKVNIKLYQLDLADLDNIKYFAKKFINENDRLDVLINNAGVMIPPYSKTKNNFELQFGTNHLGHFALTGLLLPLLEKNDNGRIITVSSIAHNPGIIDFNDLNSEKKKYSKWGSYSQSKISNLCFAIELDRRLKAGGFSTISLASHPGYSNTELQRYSILWRILNVFFAMSAKKGSEATLFAATNQKATDYIYWGPTGIIEMRGRTGKAKINKKAQDKETAKRLWSISEEMTGVKFLN